MTLNEIAARWLGLKYFIMGDIVFHKTPLHKQLDGLPIPFDPLHDRNDLVRVEEKLLSEKHCWMNFTERGFNLFPKNPPRITGNYPADYPTAILELVKTLYEGKEKDRK